MENELLAAGVGVALVAAYLVWDTLFQAKAEPPPRAVEAERVEVRAASVAAALDQLDGLYASVFPSTRPESLRLEREDNAKLLNKVIRETSPLLPATAARVWVGAHLVAIVRIPNPGYATA